MVTSKKADADMLDAEEACGHMSGWRLSGAISCGPLEIRTCLISSGRLAAETPRSWCQHITSCRPVKRTTAAPESLSIGSDNSRPVMAAVGSLYRHSIIT